MHSVNERLENPHYISNYLKIFTISVTYIGNKDGIVETVILSRFKRAQVMPS